MGNLTAVIEFSADWTVYGTFQYPSAIPSFRGSEPPINVPTGR